MDDMVRELLQAGIAAAWDAAHVLDSPEAQIRRLDALFELVDETQAQLSGLRLGLLREAQLSNAGPVLEAHRSSTRRTTARASAEFRLAEDLAQRYQLLGAALRDGTISTAQAEAMVTGLRKLPAGGAGAVSGEQLERCQRDLLAHAETLGPHELRVLALHMLEVLCPESAERSEADRLAVEERQAQAGRSLKLAPDYHGSMRISGQLPLADAALLEAQLAALLPPIASYPGQTPALEARRADSLVLLTQIAANSGQIPDNGTDRPHLHITVGLETLTTGLGHTQLLGHAGESLSAGQLRRLACDANLIPVVLGTDSQPLDVGRTHRLATKAIRAALTLRDQGCIFPHCTAPATACDAHHINPWWAGGATALHNMVLLCPHHHRLVEPDPDQSTQSQWQVRIHPGTGQPEFIPPTWIDPDRRPRQHRRQCLENLKHRPDKPDQGPSSLPPQRRQLPTLATIRLPEPKDDPWHPDYQPPPRTLAASR